MKRIVPLLHLLLVAIFLLIPGQLLGAEDPFERGLSFLKSQRYDDAIEAFSESIRIIPNDSEAYNNRGIAWFYKGDYDRAIADCTKALEINPRFTNAYNNRGTAWFYKGDYDRAIADVLGSAIGMDKDVMKRLFRDAGIPTAKFLVFHQSAVGSIDFEEVTNQLGSPVFIEPRFAGLMKTGEPS